MGKILALDIGTTSIKASLFDQAGRLDKKVNNVTPLTRDHVGAVYEPDAIWHIVEYQLKTLIASTNETILGISITGMAEAGLIVERNKKEALTPIIPWFDKRTEAISKKDQNEHDDYFETTGLHHSFKYGIYKFLWFLEEQSFERETIIWLSMCDYIAMRLTGEFVTDPTFAARTYVFDVFNQCWDENRIQAYGLELSNFPTVKPSGIEIGRFNGIPVVLAGHDHVCAAFALLYQDPKGICDSAGTSETYLGIIGANVVGNSGFPSESGLLYGPFYEDRFFYLANVPSSGHSVEWFRKTAQITDVEYEEMNQELWKLSVGPTGMMYYPYLTGIGTPLYDASYKGMLIGLTEKSNGYEMLKAVIEGIQFQACWILERIRTYHQVKLNAVTCVGGSVNNEVMMQIKADILDIEVHIPKTADATLVGAAAIFLEYHAKSFTKRFLENLLKLEKTYTPNKRVADDYQKVFQREYLPFIELLQTKKLED